MVRVDTAKLEYELMTLNDRYLVAFTDRRLEDSTIPEGLFCYDIRYVQENRSILCDAKPFVLLNYWGTILSREPLPLGEDGSYSLADWHYLAEDMTLAQFMAATPEELAVYFEPEEPSEEMSMR